METTAILTDAGAADTGHALVMAAANGCEASSKLLLRRRQLEASSVAEYVNSSCDISGATALFRSIDAVPSADGVRQLISPRIVRMLVDAGADTTSDVRVRTGEGDFYFCGTPLAYATLCLRDKKIWGEDATEEQLHRLEAARRLMLRVEAVRAVSWLWRTDAPVPQRAGDSATKANRTPTPLSLMLPVWRRRARRRGRVWAPLIRFVLCYDVGRLSRTTCVFLVRMLAHGSCSDIAGSGWRSVCQHPLCSNI